MRSRRTFVRLPSQARGRLHPYMFASFYPPLHTRVGEAEPNSPLTLAQLERIWGGSGQLPLGAALRALLQLMSELRKHHDRSGEAHGEVTPEHVLLTRDGRVFLARPSRAPLVSGFPLRYLAPEKLRGGSFDVRADVFSAGVLLWEALAGKPLSHLSTRAELLQRWREEAPPLAPVQSQELWAASLAHIAARALAINPALRYASIRQLQNALETLAGRHFANVSAWAALFRGPEAIVLSQRAPSSKPPPATKRSPQLSQLPDLSRLWGQRSFEPRRDNDDTLFDLAAGPPELDSERSLPVAAAAPQAYMSGATPDDELPTRFLEQLAPRPAPPLPPQAPRPSQLEVTPEAAPSPRGIWLWVVLVALLLGAIASALVK